MRHSKTTDINPLNFVVLCNLSAQNIQHLRKKSIFARTPIENDDMRLTSRLFIYIET